MESIILLILFVISFVISSLIIYAACRLKFSREQIIEQLSQDIHLCYQVVLVDVLLTFAIMFIYISVM